MDIERKFYEFNKYIKKSDKIELEKSNIENFLTEIQKRIEKLKEILVIDRFEGSIAICEDRNTKKISIIEKSELPMEAAEGTVLKWKNGKYVIDKDEQEKIEKQIKRKMDDLWE